MRNEQHSSERQQRPSVKRRPEKKVSAEPRATPGGGDGAVSTVKANNVTRASLSPGAVAERDSTGMGDGGHGRAATAGGGRGGDSNVVKSAAADNGYVEGDKIAAEEDNKPFCLRILLAEDSIPNQKLMSRILERAGHTVEAVSFVVQFVCTLRQVIRAAGAKVEELCFLKVQLAITRVLAPVLLS